MQLGSLHWRVFHLRKNAFQISSVVLVLSLSMVDNSAFSPSCLTIALDPAYSAEKLSMLLISHSEDFNDPLFVPALVRPHALLGVPLAF
jgi:hypothetical protein